MNEISKPKDPIMGAYEEWKVSRNDETSSKLLAALDGQIGTALHTFAGGMEDHLKLRAQTMALKAAETYDPKKGMHLKSYVYQQLQPLQREYGERVNAVKLPERQLLDRRTLDRAELEFEEANGRPPSSAELADYTSIPIRRIAYIRANKPQVAESRTLDPITGDTMNVVESNPEEIWGDYVDGLDELSKSLILSAPVMYDLLIDILDELRRATRDAIETGNREGSSLPAKLERRIYETIKEVEK